MLVSENNTSYGKDLGDIRLLETLLPELAEVDGIERIRVSYLQPAEMRPGPDRRADLDAEGRARTSTCPSSTPRPACCARCAASATPTASWSCWTPSAARRRRPASAPTSSSASPARPRPTSPSWNASSPTRGSTPSASSATPTRTAPRPATYEDKLDEDVVAERLAQVSRLAEELDRAARRGAARRDRAGAGRVRRRATTARRVRPRRPPGARDGRPGRCFDRRRGPEPSAVWSRRRWSAPRVSTWWPSRLASAGVTRRRPDDRSPGIRGGRARPPRAGARRASWALRPSTRPACGTSPTS